MQRTQQCQMPGWNTSYFPPWHPKAIRAKRWIHFLNTWSAHALTYSLESRMLLFSSPRMYHHSKLSMEEGPGPKCILNIWLYGTISFTIYNFRTIYTVPHSPQIHLGHCNLFYRLHYTFNGWKFFVSIIKLKWRK